MATIQISSELKNALDKQKTSETDTYEDILWDLVEDRMELSEETKRRIAQSEDDVRAGRVHRLEDVKRKFGL